MSETPVLTNRMTVTRALKELQLGPKKIDKAISAVTPMAIITKGAVPVGYQTLEAFDVKASSEYRSAMALIDRQAVLKAAVTQSNAVTVVDIRGKRMTVAAAINFKTEISKYRKTLLTRLASANANAESKLASLLTEYKARMDRLLETTFGKNVKVKEEDVKAVTDPFKTANEPILHDPLDVKRIIAELSDELDDIEKEIDLTLSEVNAVTFIEI